MARTRRCSMLVSMACLLTLQLLPGENWRSDSDVLLRALTKSVRGNSSVLLKLPSDIEDHKSIEQSPDIAAQKIAGNANATESSSDDSWDKLVKQPLLVDRVPPPNNQPIDITYEDVSDNHTTHPHMGAMDAYGSLGYRHDETALRANPPPFLWNVSKDDDMANYCRQQDDDYIMLSQRVFVDLEYEQAMVASGKSRPKILCVVYTIAKGHERVHNIRQTWGPKCDGFIAVSNAIDPMVDTVKIVFEGPDNYNNIWQKVRSIWSFVYDHYYESYDWFHIGGDDMFLIVENLRYYLESDEIQSAQHAGKSPQFGDNRTNTMASQQVPLFLGRRFKRNGDPQDLFNSGGPGYTLNKAALKTLVVNGLPNYFVHDKASMEDVFVSRILQKFGVYPYETKDFAGGERYMPYPPGFHYAFRLASRSWLNRYSINVKEGLEHCSPRSIAFHYVKDDLMKRLFALLYHKCPADRHAVIGAASNSSGTTARSNHSNPA